MRISEVANNSGVGVETVRFYESKGLIEQPKRPKYRGYRDYPDQTVERIRFIRSAQKLGFSLGEIAELLELEASDDAECAEVRRRAEAKRAEVEDRIKGLGKILGALDRLITECPAQGPASGCSIIETLSGEGVHFDGKLKGKICAKQTPQD